MYMVDSSTLNSPTMTLLSEQSSANSYIFSVRHGTTFLYLGMLDSTSALCMGTILNSETIKTSLQKCEKCGTKQTVKGCLFTLRDLKQEGRALSCSTRAENLHPGSPDFSLLCSCACP